MLDVLEVYERPYDPKQPVVCIDEKTKQLLREKRESRSRQSEHKRQEPIMNTHAMTHVIFLLRLNRKEKSGQSGLPEEELAKIGQYFSGI